MEMTNEEHAKRMTAMSAHVRQTLLAQCGKDADAELLDTASSAIVEMAFFDAQMMLGRGLSIVAQAAYASAVYRATEALNLLGTHNPFQSPRAPH